MRWKTTGIQGLRKELILCNMQSISISNVRKSKKSYKWHNQTYTIVTKIKLRSLSNKTLILQVWQKSKKRNLKYTWNVSKVSISKRFLTKSTIKIKNILKTWRVNILFNFNFYNLDKKHLNPKIISMLTWVSSMKELLEAFMSK